ncbi:hypothetical protein [Spirosoma flavus]
MAKATKQDIEVMQKFFDTLENHIENDEEYVSDEVLARYVRSAMRGPLASARNRVIIGCDLLIDTVCDPDKSYLEYNPDLKKIMPETQNEQGEKLFYVISYTHSSKGVLTFWGPNNAGYTTNVRRAGKYTESKIRENLSYYHQGENAVAISVEELHSRFKISENVWNNYDEKSKHMERVKLKILSESELDSHVK